MQLEYGLSLFYESMQSLLSPKTIQFYQSRLPSLIEYLGNCEIESITLNQLRAWRSSLASRNNRWGKGSSHPKEPGCLSPYTLHQYVRSCKRFFRWLMLEELLDRNPAQRLELPALPDRRPRGISSRDRDSMLAAARGKPRDYAMILVLADTACRVGGLAGLMVDDLDLAQSSGLVREKGRGGHAKERILYFTGPTVKAIRAWLIARDHQENSLFGLTEDGVYQMLKRTAARAGVKSDWNPHSFRHAAIRGWLARGMSLPAASQLAGHSSVKVTGDIYGYFSERDLQRAHDQYSWLT